MGRVSKRVYVGLEGAGKSLLLARHSMRLLHRNAHWYDKVGIKRPIVSNIAYSQWFLDLADKMGVEVRHWQNIEELTSMSECDLFIDELGTYFDSRLFADLPLNTRLWVAQAEKLGVDIYGGAQDFGQIDKAFRRLCKEVNEVRKVVGSRRPMRTAPPVRAIWGFGFIRQLDPSSFAGEQVEMKTRGFPKPFMFSKRDTRVFDTSTRVALSAPVPLQHIVRNCPECGLVKKIHR